MARAVIVRFNSNKDAEKFVNDVAERSGVNVLSDDPNLYSDMLSATVEAVIAVPTKWCECAMQDDTGHRRRRSTSRRRMVGWTRGTTYGWWLCGTCHRPSRQIVTHFITCMLNGANDLLPTILGTGAPLSSTERWRRDGGTGRPEIKVGDHHERI
jgi:hypothetical protein